MISSHEIESIILDAFEDVALLISGATTLHQLDDGLVRTLIRRLDRVRSRTLSRLTRAGDRVTPEPVLERPHHLHPAIEIFLQGNSSLPAPAKKEGQG